MKPPGFWTGTGRASRLAGLLLSPMEPITAALTARRLRRAGWDAPVPVVCCGNVGVGGAGKTTLALDLVDRIRQRGIAAMAAASVRGRCWSIRSATMPPWSGTRRCCSPGARRAGWAATVPPPAGRRCRPVRSCC
jgi:hypothetical protein